MHFEKIAFKDKTLFFFTIKSLLWNKTWLKEIIKYLELLWECFTTMNTLTSTESTCFIHCSFFVFVRIILLLIFAPDHFTAFLYFRLILIF